MACGENVHYKTMEFTMKFKLLVLGIFVFASTVAFAMAIHTYVLRSRAAGTSMPIRITEKTGSIASTKDVTVSFSNTEKISAFMLVFKTTGAVKVQSTREPSILGNPSTPAGFFNEFIKTTEKISYGIQKADADLPAGISIPVTLRCEGTGPGTFTIAAVGSEIVGSGKQYVLDSIEEGSYTCASGGISPTGVPTGIRAHFSPASAQLTVGQQITTNLLVDGFAADQKVSAFDVKMKVDAGVDVVVSGSNPAPTSTAPTGSSPTAAATPGSSINNGGGAGGTTPGSSTAGGAGAPGGGSSTTNPFAPVPLDAVDNSECTTVIHNWDTATRILRVSQLCTAPTLLSSVSIPVTLKGVSNSTGTVSISEYEIVGPQAPSGYSVAKETFAFTVGSGGGSGNSGNMQLRLKLRLQGIQAKPRQTGGIQFKIGAQKTGQQSTATQTALFTPDDSGFYVGSVGLNLTPGTGFCISVKGGFQLQKKVCDASPTETAPGTYKGERGAITLNAGENSFDFSRIYQMSCDLPVQDGICNSQDLVKIRANIGKTDAQANNITDLNQDGTTNGADFAIGLTSFSQKVDD